MENLLDAAKGILQGKFITIQSYLKKEENYGLDKITLHLKQLEPKTNKQKKIKISRRKEIIKI